MSMFRRIDIFESSPPLFIRESSIFKPRALTLAPFAEEDELDFALDLLNPNPNPLPLQCLVLPPCSPFEVFDAATDLIQIDKTPFCSSYRRVQRRSGVDHCLQSLSDRVSALELGLDRVVNAKAKNRDRKYTWTAEIKDPEENGVERKYKCVAEIKGGKKDGEKNYKWISEIKGKGKDAPYSQTYTFKASTSPTEECSKPVKSKKKDSKNSSATRAILIEEPPVDQGAIFLRQAFAKRVGADANGKGKKKELSPQDAAMLIQMSFRAYLIRRSKALRALRELAVKKSKLKELRQLFNNFSYRRRIVHDAEERQKFSEKIIVLLIAVDQIEGADIMVRAAKRSMVDELEAMLDVVDPQPRGKFGSMRRKFDLPEGGIQNEIAAGVAEVVQMINQQENGSFEVCL